jgi:uncharacterized protein (DUF362 family)
MIKRRHFLGLLTGELAALSLRAATTAYQAGIGSSSDPYTATQRAIAASGQFPAAKIAGSTVVIKPNLVEGRPASSGATTDPQVVRAVVDLALSAGAFSIIVAEGGVGANPVPFASCGYDFFSTYNPRVQLMDFGGQPYSSAAVPSGLSLKSLYVPNLVLEPNVVLISVAKLKTHSDAGITASMKNLFSLPVPVEYSVPGKTLKRQDLHFRGIDECIVDVNIVARPDFAVIDGIVGMEGDGPLFGTPVTVNLVIAGLNPVAVDLVALQVMKISQNTVPHLTYAGLRGLGPLDMTKVAILGDPYTPVAFTPAKTPPVIWRPTVFPASFSPASGQTTSISYSVPAACLTSAAIIQDNDTSPGITVVKTLQGWTQTAAGVTTLTWAGDTDAGGAAAPGLYLAQVMSTQKTGGIINYATSWVTVKA